MKMTRLWMTGYLVLLAASAAAQNTFPASGNAGIGTTAPSTPLQVTGTDNVITLGEANPSSGKQVIIGMNISGNGYGTIQAVYQGTAYTPLILNPNSGNVGVGTTAPASVLTLASSSDTNPNSGSQRYYANGGLTFQSSLGFTVGRVAAVQETGYYEDRGDLALLVGQGGGNEVELMRLQGSTLNVGIGTASPEAKLEVNGNLKLSSGSGASVTFADSTVQSTAWTGSLCGGDYAESVDVSGDRAHYEPGDVLMLDLNIPGNVLKVAEPYLTLAAGIYSTKPGVVGRRQNSDPKSSTTEVPMAMVGVVPTKVSAENGPIKVGDLLVTSSTPGHAMKGTDRNLMLGAVVGKAMGKLDAGTGVIEVLVSLQ